MDRSQMIRWIALVHYMMGVFAGRFVCVLHTRSEKVGRIVSLFVTLLIIACSETVRVLGVYTRTHLVVEQCITDPYHPLQAFRAGIVSFRFYSASTYSRGLDLMPQGNPGLWPSNSLGPIARHKTRQ